MAGIVLNVLAAFPVVLLALSAVRGQSSCEFRVPMKASASSGCVHYSLGALDKKEGYLVHDASSSDMYLINVCDNVDPSSLPAQCKSKAPAPGYQINGSCPILGELSSTLAVSLEQKR